MGEWTLPTVGGLLLVYAGLSQRLKTSPASQTMVFVTAGLLFGNRASLPEALVVPMPRVRAHARGVAQGVTPTGQDHAG